MKVYDRVERTLDNSLTAVDVSVDAVASLARAAGHLASLAEETAKAYKEREMLMLKHEHDIALAEIASHKRRTTAAKKKAA
mgnify:FL=1|jgi:hypothetical protein